MTAVSQEKANNDKDLNTNVCNQYLAAVTASLSTFSYGCVLGWLSPALTQLQSSESVLGDQLTPNQSSWTASIICLGAFFGTVLFGIIGDVMGRKWSAILLSVPYSLGWLLLILVPTVPGLLTGRFFLGMGGGGSLLMAPLYCREVSSIRVRGSLGSIAILAISFGVLYSFVIGSIFSYIITLWIHLTVPIVYAVIFFFMPETPSFLVMQEKYDKAAESIAWLRKLSPKDDVCQDVLADLKHETHLAAKSTSGASFKEVVFTAVTIKGFIVFLVLFFIQSFTGMFAVLNFASVIFEDAGSDISPNDSSIILGVLQLVGSCLSVVLIERLGRKVLYIFSNLIGCVCLGASAIYFYLKASGSDVSNISWIPISALPLSICVFALGAGPIPYIILNEIFVIQVRALATTLIIFWVWVNVFLVSQFFITAVEMMGFEGSFAGFSAIMLFGAIFCYFCVPETKGKHLDDILVFFDKDFKTKNQISVVVDKNIEGNK